MAALTVSLTAALMVPIKVALMARHLVDVKVEKMDNNWDQGSVDTRADL